MGNVSKLPVNGLEWKRTTSKFNEKFIKIYEDNDEEYIREVDVEYSKKLQNLRNDLPFLLERMKIKTCNKLVCNLYDKSN